MAPETMEKIKVIVEQMAHFAKLNAKAAGDRHETATWFSYAARCDDILKMISDEHIR